MFVNNSEYLSSRITNKGRQKISQGNFKIEYFQIGDSEYDYNFSDLNGTNEITNPSQKVFYPLDNDSTIKYPYKISESLVSGTTFGVPVQMSEIKTITNRMGAAGFVSQYVEYTTGSTITGVTVGCDFFEINISQFNGTQTLTVPTGQTFTSGDYITVIFDTLVGSDPLNPVISGNTNSLIYKIKSYSGNTITLDRNTPNLTGLTGQVTIIYNKCNPFFPNGYTGDTACAPNTQSPEDRQDPWTLNVVWGDKPAGMDVPTSIDQQLSGYTSSVYTSTKEFFGYTSSSGQINNNSTTYKNSFDELISVLPEEQHTIAIIHYDQNNNQFEPEKFFKYEDFIGHKTTVPRAHFQVYIPFLLYHRNVNNNIGVLLKMGNIDMYINSSASDTKTDKLKYRYLIDDFGNNVGKIFVNHKIIVIDDQEIVAALDYKSNRKYTLPAPRVNLIPININCVGNELISDEPLLSTTGDTLYVSYLFELTGNTSLNGMHCNYYTKINGVDVESNASVSFSSQEFIFMKNTLNGYKDGYIANKFYILAQIVNTGEQPQPDSWKIMDYTDRIPNHTVGGLIDPENMRGSMFIINYDEYENASLYDLEDFIGDLPNQSEVGIPDDPPQDSPTPLIYRRLPQFGDTQPFPGAVRVARSTDLHVMRYLINLPENQFVTTQNPTWTAGKEKKITEVALLDENKDVIVIGKMTKPISRLGSQVLTIKVDF